MDLAWRQGQALEAERGDTFETREQRLKYMRSEPQDIDGAI